jgi:ABC-type multidrug transport system ATPase subunit
VLLQNNDVTSSQSKMIQSNRRCSLRFEGISHQFKQREVLRNVSGAVYEGTILVVIGPSGCGKSTLFDLLVGKTKVQKGKIETNPIAYVPQEDVFFERLTPREMLTFHCSFTKGYGKDYTSVIRVILSTLGLTACADLRNGLSGGQKKRLSIGMAFLSNHPILLLDEPTTGLDSTAAYFIIRALKQITHEDGRSVIISVHQPPSAVFDMMDWMLLLTNSGQVAYYGQSSLILTHLESKLGQRCQIHHNPFDFIFEMLVDHANTLVAVAHPFVSEGVDIQPPNPYANKRVAEVHILSKRVLYLFIRDIGLTHIRFGLYIASAIVFGLVFTSESLLSMMYIVPVIFTFMTCSVLPYYMREKQIFQLERRNKTYLASSFIVTCVLQAMPSTLLLASISGSITFALSNNSGAFVPRFFLPFWLLFLIGDLFTRFVSMMTSHYMIGLVLCCGYWGVALVLEGFLIPLSSVHWSVRWIAYLTPFRPFFNAVTAVTRVEFATAYNTNAYTYGVDILVLVVFYILFLLGFIVATIR